MKLDFDWQNDGKLHQYCIQCYAESVHKVVDEGKIYYFCASCNKRHDRLIVIDPKIKWWVGEGGEYWHESAGVFIRNHEYKFLFFERVKFPFAITIPAGHVDEGEDPLTAMRREAQEEVGLIVESATKIMSEDIIGDSCRRGCDAHRWHAYLIVLNQNIDLKMLEEEEGHMPTWLTLDEAIRKDLTFPVRYIIEHYRDKLLT
ncbi:NUDIX domain-containing protein [Candidatus Saccharibacteria bacterium]|nr:NUDIX domain-containing protein [Candidatus Saccharibacteria bacterium]MCB9821078.1 NUDIX domain-containing protein [Candidatus Nomurabacteria bacterium]